MGEMDRKLTPMKGDKSVVSPPDFQAVGTLEGSLQLQDSQLFQFVTVDGLTLDTLLTPRSYPSLRGYCERIGQPFPWTVYPKTDPQGDIIFVRLSGYPPSEDRKVDEFWISGRVGQQQAGVISVRIHPNRCLTLDGVRSVPLRSFPPFFVNLQGELPGEAIGELWRFTCQRQGLRLEIRDGFKVKDR
ncbi:MAG: hypothetical protein QNJ46_01670 [Leptolyngbyaceae cyanobacterium MO_188.B28]|nr:hypothetical protein [Leptolyngbyaceae cyanobacterium MO_188.B28]